MKNNADGCPKAYRRENVFMVDLGHIHHTIWERKQRKMMEERVLNEPLVNPKLIEELKKLMSKQNLWGRDKNDNNNNRV